MKRCTHRQYQRTLGAPCLARRRAPFYRCFVAGNDHLVRRVEVDGFHHLCHACQACLTRLSTGRAHGVIVQAQYCGHRAGAGGHSFLHGLRAKPHQRHRVFERNHTGRNQRGVFPQAVTRDPCRRRAAHSQPRAIHGDTGGQHHGLRIDGGAQLIRGAFGHQLP